MAFSGPNDSSGLLMTEEQHVVSKDLLEKKQNKAKQLTMYAQDA